MEGPSEEVTLKVRPECQEASHAKARRKAFQEEGPADAKAHRLSHAWRSRWKVCGWSVVCGLRWWQTMLKERQGPGPGGARNRATQDDRPREKM